MRHLKSLTVSACAAILLSASASAAPETFSIDANHSTIGFKIKHLFSYVTGRFGTVAGTLVLDPAKPESSTVNVQIQVDSINTGNEKRDAHLKSPDFFDATKFPLMKFESKTVKQTGPDAADVTGELTLHGVTKEVPLKVHFLGKGPGMKPGEIRAGFEATAQIKRSEFGLVWNKVIEGTQVVGDDVAISLEIEAVKQP